MGRALQGIEVVYDLAKAVGQRWQDYVDNASSAYFFMGNKGVSPRDLDLTFEAVALSINGKCVATATGAAVQGHPADALALAANELATRGEYIKAGEIVLTGGLTDAIPVHAGIQVSAEFTNLGSLFITAA